jgi:hypothetical protein
VLARPAAPDRPFALAARQAPVIDRLELTCASGRSHPVGLDSGGQRRRGRPAALRTSVKRHTQRFPRPAVVKPGATPDSSKLLQLDRKDSSARDPQPSPMFRTNLRLQPCWRLSPRRS